VEGFTQGIRRVRIITPRKYLNGISVERRVWILQSITEDRYRGLVVDPGGLD
jgi:hypothetical protein